ncbi:hypothetical protein NKJ26_28045 [Mesorhizobium sp. M0152]|uniref:hypothetical protein n=1 Tax=Mesorhizobium sp. M0152 TaxID=2956898 RepID=UPI00333E008D
MRDMPLEDRREILAEMIAEGQRIQFSEALAGGAKEIFHLIDKAGLEGMVSKQGQQIPKRQHDGLAKEQGFRCRRI